MGNFGVDMGDAREELKREIRKTEDADALGKVEDFVRALKADKEKQADEPVEASAPKVRR